MDSLKRAPVLEETLKQNLFSLKKKVWLKREKNNFKRKKEGESNKSNGDCRGNTDYWQKGHEGALVWHSRPGYTDSIGAWVSKDLISPPNLFLPPSLPPSPTLYTHSHPPSLLGCKRHCFCFPEMPLPCLPKLFDGGRKLRKDSFLGLPGRGGLEQGRAGSGIGGRRAEPTPVGADSSISGQASSECVRRSCSLLRSLQNLNARAWQALLC